MQYPVFLMPFVLAAMFPHIALIFCLVCSAIWGGLWFAFKNKNIYKLFKVLFFISLVPTILIGGYTVYFFDAFYEGLAKIVFGIILVIGVSGIAAIAVIKKKIEIKDVFNGVVTISAVLICVYTFTNVNTRCFTDIFAGKVTQQEIEDGFFMDLIGKKAGEDVPLLTSKDVTFSYDGEDSIFNYDYDFDSDFIQLYAVETDNVIPIGYYELKDYDNAVIERSRGRTPITKPKRTEEPFIFYNFYYAGYYLVELDDGSYILSFMNQDYENSKRLPLAQKIGLEGSFEDRIIEFTENNDDIDIEDVNFDYMLVMHTDRNNFFSGVIDFVARLAATLIVGALFLAISIFISKYGKDEDRDRMF